MLAESKNRFGTFILESVFIFASNARGAPRADFNQKFPDGIPVKILLVGENPKPP